MPEPTSATSQFAALSVPNFRALWLNNICFYLVAQGMRFAFGWYILDGLDLGNTEQGFVIFMLGLPSLFFTLQAGAWADRYDRKRLLIISQVLKGTVMAGAALLILADEATIGWIAALAFLAGSASVIGSPVRSSLIPSVVQGDLLFNAIALNAFALTASLVVGPVLVQIFGRLFGFEGAFFLMAALLWIGLIFASQLHIPPIEAPTERLPLRKATGVAVAHIRASKALTKLFGLLTLSSLVVTPLVMVSMPAYLKEEFGRDSGDAGMLFAAMGLGIAISTFVVMRQGNMPNKGKFFMRAMTFGSTMTTLVGLTTEYWQLFPIMTAMGLASGFFVTMNQGLIQANTPNEIMGRVMGIFTLIMGGLIPFGALLAGVISDWIGVGNTIVIGGTFTVAVLVAVLHHRPRPQAARIVSYHAISPSFSTTFTIPFCVINRPITSK